MGFEIPKFDSFCFCSLRTGSITVAVLQVLTLLLYTVSVSVSTILYMRRYKEVRIYDIASYLLYSHSLFIQTLFCILLLYGILKEKSCFIVAWLLFVTAELIALIWNTILNSSHYFHWSVFLEDFLVIGFEAVAMLVVYNYYRKMPKESY